MDRPNHPHVIRTWAVDRIRGKAPHFAPSGKPGGKTSPRRPPTPADRRKQS
jgi:hypothetical protein